MCPVFIDTFRVLQFSRFVAIRFIMAIVTLLIVTFIVFSLMELGPSYVDRCAALVAEFGADRSLLDRNYVTRWVYWVTDVFCTWRFWLVLHFTIVH